MPQLNSHTAVNTQCNQIHFLKRLMTPWFVHTRKQIYSGVQCTAWGMELAPVSLLENKFLVWKKKKQKLLYCMVGDIFQNGNCNISSPQNTCRKTVLLFYKPEAALEATVLRHHLLGQHAIRTQNSVLVSPSANLSKVPSSREALERSPS